MNWGRLGAKKKRKMFVFVEGCFETKSFDIYMHHSIPYMEAVNKELKALEGILCSKKKGKYCGHS